jgi:hypothetical protein
LDGRTLANLAGPDKGPRAAEMHEGEDGYAGAARALDMPLFLQAIDGGRDIRRQNPMGR